MHGHVMIEHAIDPRQLFEIFGLAVAGWKCQVLDLFGRILTGKTTIA